MARTGQSPTPGRLAPRIMPRAYQVELFEASMKQNIIVTMDTGSGKTQVAKLRIEAELERSSPEKIVWFIAPTRILAEQQYKYLSSQLSSYSSRLISGSDRAENWSSAIWTAIMPASRFIVSTPQILFDALSHGYVQFGTIALLVFDEAHHCTRNHPTHRIMRGFYHSVPVPDRLGRVPHILGLSASPITSGKHGEHETLELNLNAVCKAPTDNLEELMRHVHEPRLQKLMFEDEEMPVSIELNRLIQIIQDYNTLEDPFVRSLDNQSQAKFLLSRKATKLFTNLQTLARRARELHLQIGAWGSSFYLHAYEQKLAKVLSSYQGVNVALSALSLEWQERAYMHQILTKILDDQGLYDSSHLLTSSISSKVKLLLKFLSENYKPSLRGIIFVKERTTAAVLSTLISSHPMTKDRFEAVPFVGGSDGQGKQTAFDLVDKKGLNTGLADFVSGQKNLLVSTSVTEEGIDVPAANLVVRFDQPANFRAFIQSRGRARQSQSIFVWMCGKNEPPSHYEAWNELEQEMKQKYLDDQRVVNEYDQSDGADLRYEEILESETTGARLSIHDAKQHLQHFCDQLPKVRYVEPMRPEYILECPEAGSFRADVVLPQSVNIESRRIRGKRVWRSWKMATKDAAFRAYCVLRDAGLINENLLPTDLPDPVGVECDISDQRESMIVVRDRIQPWDRPSDKRNIGSILTIEIVGPGRMENGNFHLKLPWITNTTFDFKLTWTLDQMITVKTFPQLKSGVLSSERDLERLGKISTRLLFKSVFVGNDDIQRRLWISPLVIFPHLDCQSIAYWNRQYSGALESSDRGDMQPHQHLVRLRGQLGHGRPYVFQSRLMQLRDLERFPPSQDSPDSVEEELHFGVTKLPKRRDYLHAPASNAFNTATDCLPASDCVVDLLPAKYGRSMVLLPSILHRLELREVAASLQREMLPFLDPEDLDLVEEAICAPRAMESNNYESLEFFGDTILKLFTSAQLCADKPSWHEGYLSRAKHRIVSNAHLCESARNQGLDEFIHTKAFAASRWKPPVPAKGHGITSAEAGREISTKLMGDVIEALIGASFMSREDRIESMDRAKACLATFLTERSWRSPAENAMILQRLVPDDSTHYANHYDSLTQITGYTFSKNFLLVEALTHPSHPVGLHGTYQRLEYLGDAVLEFVIVEEIARWPQKHTHVVMHLIKEALVNAHLLAFLSFETQIQAGRVELESDRVGKHFHTRKDNKQTRLWEFMKHAGSPEFLQAQKECIKRYEELGSTIRTALHEGTEYPWCELHGLHAEKFFSDLIESILGAIFVDSGGDIQPCRDFLKRLGLFNILERMLSQKIDVVNPKGRLGIRTGSSQIKYVVDTKMTDSGLRYSCSVFIDTEMAGSSVGEIGRRAAEARAAQNALAWVAEKVALGERIDWN